MLLKNIFYILISAIFSVGCSFVFVGYLSLNNYFWPFSIGYFILLFFIINVFYTFKIESEEFTQLLVGGFIVKLLLALIIILVFSIRKTDYLSFALHFISHYILFTIFEIRYLLLLIRKYPFKPRPHEK